MCLNLNFSKAKELGLSEKKLEALDGLFAPEKSPEPPPVQQVVEPVEAETAEPVEAPASRRRGRSRRKPKSSKTSSDNEVDYDAKPRDRSSSPRVRSSHLRDD
jgi:hypothetical protein